jgi:hypothetical protein
VPQNKNSIMAYAIRDCLKERPEIKSITMRYSLPGHSAVQDVDNVHGAIEKTLRVNEVFSPLGLIRLLKTVNRKRPYVILQMQPKDFLAFTDTAKMLECKNV